MLKLKKENFLIQVKYSDLILNADSIGEHFLGFGWEFYLTVGEIEGCDRRLINSVKSFIEENHLLLTLHGPIAEIDYSQVQKALSHIRPLYEKVTNLCRILGISSVVAHAEFNYESDFPIEEQFKNAAFLWRVLFSGLASSGVKLNIENHYETNPDYLIALYKKINSSEFGMCVDIGHCNAFGASDMREWLDAYPSGSIREVHLADNNADKDAHLPLGRGNIDFTRFFDLLEKRNEKAIFVLEPNNIAEAKESLFFLKERGLIG